MQKPDRSGVDTAVAFFDVVISMPPGATLESIMQLAQSVAGLPPERVERLIDVLRTTPHAKVATAVALDRAVEEKIRFIKAGLLVEIVSVLPTQALPAGDTTTNTHDAASAISRSDTSTAAQKNAGNTKDRSKDGSKDASSGTLKKAGLLVGIVFGIVLGLGLAWVTGLATFGDNGLASSAVSMPWGKKLMPTVTGSATGAPGQAAAAAAANASFDSAGAAMVEVDDALIQQARTASANAPVGTAPAGSADAVPQQSKQILTVELATLLAEIGQAGRARELLDILAGNLNPTTDAQLATALDVARLKVQAWSLQGLSGSQARQAADDLRVKLQAMTNPQERALLLGQVAVILSRNSQLAPSVPRMFLSMGEESLKAANSAQTPAGSGELTLSMAEVLQHETTARAKTGQWTKARANAAQIEDLLKQSPDAWVQARLLAIDHQAKIQTGQFDKASKSLESALALATNNTSLPERAMWLRSIAQLSDGSTQEQFEAVASALQNQLNAKSGIEKARGLTELSLLYTAAGLPGKSAQLRALAQTTTGLSAAEALAISTDLKVRSDIAMAKSLHGLGRYADAEVVLRRVGGYLF